PTADHFYGPGSWVYSSYRYVWRPGCWVVHRPGWVWIAASYRWTPAGYVYIDGYWDYPLAARGILFAPVYVDLRYCYRPGWYYAPRYVVYEPGLYGSLFVRTGCSSYYFGDYFEARYTSLGYHSWFSVSIGVGYRSPLRPVVHLLQRDLPPRPVLGPGHPRGLCCPLRRRPGPPAGHDLQQHDRRQQHDDHQQPEVRQHQQEHQHYQHHQRQQQR